MAATAAYAPSLLPIAGQTAVGGVRILVVSGSCGEGEEER